MKETPVANFAKKDRRRREDGVAQTEDEDAASAGHEAVQEAP